MSEHEDRSSSNRALEIALTTSNAEGSAQDPAPATLNACASLEELLDQLLDHYGESVLGPAERAAQARPRLRSLLHLAGEAAVLHDQAARPTHLAGTTADIEKVSDLCAEVGRMCHKINNPLTSVLGRVQMMRMTQAPDLKTDQALSAIEEAGQSVAALVRQLARHVAEFECDVLGQDS